MKADISNHKIVGYTVEKKPVISGLAKFYFQDGLPLSIIFDRCIIEGFQPSFPHLYNELKENGMTHDRIIHLLNEHIFESYGKDYRDVVIDRLNKFMKC